MMTYRIAWENNAWENAESCEQASSGWSDTRCCFYLAALLVGAAIGLALPAAFALAPLVVVAQTLVELIVMVVFVRLSASRVRTRRIRLRGWASRSSPS